MFGSRRVARNTQGAVASLSFHGYGVKEFEGDPGFKIFYPSGTAANDIAVLFENASQTDPIDEFINPGWTKVYSEAGSIPSYSSRVQISYKVLTEFDGLTSINGMDAAINNMILLIFRPNAAPLGATAYALDYQRTSGNPSQRTIAAQGGDVPLISFGWYASFLPIDPRYSSVTMTEVADNTNNNSFVKYKIYNVGDTPENINIDMDDESTTPDHINTLAGFYLKII